MKRIWSLFTVAAACLCVTAVATAQTQTPQQAPGGQQQQQQNPAGQAQPGFQPGAGQPAQSPSEADRRFSFNAAAAGAAMQAMRRSPDAELAACLTVDNELEVHIGQLAQQKAQNDDVKKFAGEMVAVHGQMIEKLQRFAGDAGQATRTTVGTAGVAPSDRNATNTVAAPATPNAQAGGQPQSQQQAVAGQPLDHIALKRELGELCKQTIDREFGQKSGAEFDKCYIGQQIGAHLQAIDHMKVAANHAGPELKQSLEEGIQTAQQHLQHAKDLAKKLEGNPSTSN